MSTKLLLINNSIFSYPIKLWTKIVCKYLGSEYFNILKSLIIILRESFGLLGQKKKCILILRHLMDLKNKQQKTNLTRLKICLIEIIRAWIKTNKMPKSPQKNGSVPRSQSPVVFSRTWGSTRKRCTPSWNGLGPCQAPLRPFQLLGRNPLSLRIPGPALWGKADESESSRDIRSTDSYHFPGLTCAQGILSHYVATLRWLISGPHHPVQPTQRTAVHPSCFSE